MLMKWERVSCTFVHMPSYVRLFLGSYVSFYGTWKVYVHMSV